MLSNVGFPGLIISVIALIIVVMILRKLFRK